LRITILLGATRGIYPISKNLKYHLDVKADPNKSGLWNLIKVRLFSFGLMIAIAFILIVS
jgi:membrane protein